MHKKDSSLYNIPRHTHHSGFTIVELLVVIVVIGILAAITIVSYTGISQRATVASLTSDLSNSSSQMKLYYIDHGAYPASFDTNNCPLDSSSSVDTRYCIKLSPSTSYQYTVNSSVSPSTFCITASKNTTVYKTTNDNSPSSGDCTSFGLVLSLDAGNSASYPGTGTTWTDLSGNSNNGTLMNGVAYSSVNGGVMSFDGVDDYAIATRPMQDDFTLSYWFKTTQSSGSASQWYSGMGLVDGEVSGVVNDFGTSIGAGKVMFGIGNPDTTIVSPLSYNNGVWHFVSATRIKSSGVFILYIDGVSIGSATGNTNSLTSPLHITIGSIQTIQYYFAGNINDIRIYNRASSATEILQNFNTNRARYGV